MSTKKIIPRKTTTHKKKAQKKKKYLGFTMVELVIVIIVIAILATIVIVAYNGIKARAIETSIKSDLSGNAKNIEVEKTNVGTYPANSAAINQGQGPELSPGNTITYNIRPYGFCLSISNGSIGPFNYKSINGVTGQGNCDIATTTPAGSGVAGFLEGTGTAARFNNPNGVALDSSGNLYIADYTNNRIRMITPAGVVSTLAGSGAYGFAEGTGTAAQFAAPGGVGVDGAGNVYVVDSENNRIRMITPAGVVSTLAGSGAVGSLDGTGAAATFAYPYGITVTKDGVIYVADGSRIRKVTSAGVVTTIAGGTVGYVDGPAASARFANAYGIAVDANGTLYIADTTNHKIRVLSTSGYVSTLAGSTSGFVDGIGTAARFNQPYGIAVDSSGAVYVGDSQNHSIRAISPDGVVTTLGGNGAYGYADGNETTARFRGPGGMAASSDGTVYVTDGGNHRIRKISL